MDKPRTLRDAAKSPIPPIRAAAGWKEIPVRECGEPLVPLGMFVEPGAPGFSPRIYGNSIYWGEREDSPYAQGELGGALITQFVRKGVAERLAKAAEALPEDYAFLVFDAYRPLAVQKSLYDDYYGQLRKKRGMNPDEAAAEAQRFVSIPSADPKKPSPHNTGGAVDFTIIKFESGVVEKLNGFNRDLESANWEKRYEAEMWRAKLVREHSALLDMGTAFDAAIPEAVTRFYEEKLLAEKKLSPKETEILENRRVFYHIVSEAGLSSYIDEWWHKDCGNQFDAGRAGHDEAIYGAADFSAACKAWEEIRVQHYRGMLHCLEPAAPATKLGPAPLLQFVQASVRATGHPGKSFHPQASRLVV